MTPAEQVVLEALAESPFRGPPFFESRTQLFIEMADGTLAHTRKRGLHLENVARALAKWIGCLCLVLAGGLL